MSKDTGLTVSVENDELVIRIGISALCFAVQHADQNIGDDGATNLRIKDEKAFAEDIVRELDDEDEEGQTVVHFLFDAAAEKAIENGSEHVGVIGDHP